MSYEFEDYSIGVIADHMQKFCPIKSKSNNQLSYEEIATKYIDITVNAFLCAEIGEQEDTYYIWKDTIRNQLTNKYNGNNRWYTWLNANYPLFHTLQDSHKGNTQGSLVKSHVNSQLLTLYSYHNNHRLAGLSALPHSAQCTVTTAIDLVSLSNHRDNLVYSNSTETNRLTYHKRCRKIHKAGVILGLAAANNGNLVQPLSSSEWPRHYLSGVNLQNNTTSDVREAALGTAYKYDINSSAFAFKTTIIQGYCKQNGYEHKPTAMLQLLNNKKGVRNMLVYDVLKNTQATPEYKQKIIKKAITALGFGAKLGINSKSMVDTIWNQVDRELFINHEWVKQFQLEQQLFTEIIRESFDSTWVKANMPAALKNGRYNQAKLESYLYAQFETAVMSQIIQTIGEQLIRLWVHDCVYTVSRVDLDRFNHCTQQMGFPLIQFSAKKIQRINHNLLRAHQHKQIELEHKQAIQKEERVALNWKSSWVDTRCGNTPVHPIPRPIQDLQTVWQQVCEEEQRKLNPLIY